MNTKLYYVHDPMCSWCWAFGETWQQIQTKLPTDIQVIRLLGGLAPDNDHPMPEETQQQVKQAWRQIEQRLPHKRFNFEFWDKNQPRRSTYPACRAVIAARQQGLEYDLLMTQSIQNGYYQQARNPSDDVTLISLAEELGLDKAQFVQQLNATETQHELQKEVQQSRQLKVSSFPSLVLQHNREFWPVEIDYNDANVTLEVIDYLLSM